MDITNLFKQRVEVVRNRNKALGTISPGESTGSNVGKSKLFPGRKTEYYSKARELVSTIKNLQEYLTEVRAPYLSLNAGPYPTERTASKYRRTAEPAPIMSDNEKEQVDLSVQKIIQNSQKRISEFDQFIEARGVEEKYPQLHAHLSNVLNSLRDYLKEVCGNYAEMRAIRVKRTINAQAMARITPKSPFQSPSSERRSSNATLISDDLDGPAPVNDPLAGFFADEEYTAAELQMFEEENSMLLRSLHTVADEVDQIETSVIQIAQLQEVFMEKVMVQNQEVDVISNLVIGTTENIKGGNEQIRQAIQQNADFRAWVLFFIIVMSLSLLFLDWYND